MLEMEAGLGKERKRFPLYAQTLVGMAVGTALGLRYGADVAYLGKLAKFVIDIIKTAAVPLLFLAILDTFLRAEFLGRALFRMLGISALNATGAIAIALAIANLFHPGRALKLADRSAASTPPNAGTARALELVMTSPMIAAIAVSVALGLLFLILQKQLPGFATKAGVTKIRALVEKALGLWMKLMGLILYLVPWAVFGAVAKVVGEHGFSMLHGLGVYLVVCLGGMALQIALVYHTWIRFIAKMPLPVFWREAKEPVIHAFGINSSLATLPLTLKSLKALKVSDASARLSACIGTNFNNDGILLYEVVAVLFLSQSYGHDLSIAQQLLTAIICIVATIGVGGVPEAGFISLALVLGAVHLPTEGLPILLTVDWVIGRCRSATNALGDLTVAIALDSRR